MMETKRGLSVGPCLLNTNPSYGKSSTLSRYAQLQAEIYYSMMFLLSKHPQNVTEQERRAKHQQEAVAQSVVYGFISKKL